MIGAIIELGFSRFSGLTECYYRFHPASDLSGQGPVAPDSTACSTSSASQASTTTRALRETLYELYEMLPRSVCRCGWQENSEALRYGARRPEAECHHPLCVVLILEHIATGHGYDSLHRLLQNLVRALAQRVRPLCTTQGRQGGLMAVYLKAIIS